MCGWSFSTPRPSANSAASTHVQRDQRRNNSPVQGVCIVVEGLIELAGQLEGVQVKELAPLTTILVWTWNSLYRLVVLEDSSVSVQGGALFPRPTTAQLEGASLGRRFVMTGWICVGLLMELHVDGRRVMTSPVVAIATEPVRRTVVH